MGCYTATGIEEPTVKPRRQHASWRLPAGLAGSAAGNPPSGYQQRVRVSIAADLDQPILAVMHPKPIPITFGRIGVDPPEIQSRINRIGFVGGPCRPFNQIEHRPPGLVKRRTGKAECPSCSVRPVRTASRRKPPAPKSCRRPFEEVQAAGRYLKPVEISRVPAAQKYAIQVNEQ